jgi:hypothetical protein
MTELDRTFKVNDRDVIAETIDGEVLILNLKTGVYYSAEGTAAAVWQQMMQHLSTRQIVEGLCRRYGATPDEVEGSVLSFIGELKTEELVLEAGPASNSQLSTPETQPDGGNNFTQPSLKKYTDMQELLLLDPIHEVDEAAGWPVAKPEA